MRFDNLVIDFLAGMCCEGSFPFEDSESLGFCLDDITVVNRICFHELTLADYSNILLRSYWNLPREVGQFQVYFSAFIVDVLPKESAYVYFQLLEGYSEFIGIHLVVVLVRDELHSLPR